MGHGRKPDDQQTVFNEAQAEGAGQQPSVGKQWHREAKLPSRGSESHEGASMSRPSWWREYVKGIVKKWRCGNVDLSLFI